jgi:poly(3-hydroxybutyrate) depolymerase
MIAPPGAGGAGTGAGGNNVSGGAGLGAGGMTAGAGGTSGGMTAPPDQAGAGGSTAGAGSGGEGPPPSGSTGCGAASPPADGTQMIDVAGMQREFIVQLPDDYDSSTPYKLVFAWHGLGGTASRIASGGFYGLSSRSMGTVIFVAGQGLETSNQVGTGPGWDNMGGRDVAFTSAMLAHLRESYCIDDERIFSVGMSYGGIMSNTVGCALGDDFRAIAPMAGSGPRQFGGSACTGQVAAWITHGNTDTVVPYSSGQASRDHWVGANHCDTTTAPAGSNGCVAYQGCDDGHPVVWCEFSGGHTVPMFASAEVWAFFSQF